MGKGWARQEAKTNEIASVIEQIVLWTKFHQQIAVWGGAGILAAAVLGGTLTYRHFAGREEAWGKFALANSLAYSGRPDQAAELVKKLEEEHPGTLAAGHAALLAGDILFQQGKFKEAAAAFRGLAERTADKTLLPLALADTGITLESSGECKEAVSTEQTFLDAYQDHFLAPQVHASMARCLGALGDAEKAKAAYERIVFLYPDSYWSEWAKNKLKG
jgi:tetratricopeptide (TPR) repeat protein